MLQKFNQAPVMYGISTILIWSVTALGFCYLKSMPLLQLVAIMLLSGGIISSLFQKTPLISFRRHHFDSKTVLQIVLFIAHLLLYPLAFRYAPSAHVDLIHYMWPMFFVLGSSLYKKNSLSFIQCSGIFVLMFSLFVLFIPQSQDSPLNIHYIGGYLLAFLASLVWTSYCLLKESMGKIRSKDTSEFFFFFGVLFLLLAWLFDAWEALTLTEVAAVALLGSFIYGLAFPFWKKALESKEAMFVGSLANLIPLLSVSLLVLGGFVSFSPSLLTATILTTVGCVLINKTPQKLSIHVLKPISTGVS